MQDLDAIECVFRHAERDGFFVVRCLEPECSLRIADQPPFKYKRAFNHFTTKHLKQLQPEEYIFNEFSYQGRTLLPHTPNRTTILILNTVEDATEEAVAARYSDNLIPECMVTWSR